MRARNVFLAQPLLKRDSRSQDSGGTEVSEIETYRGKALEVKALIEYSTDSVVSKTLIDTKAGVITLFSFDAGQCLSEHTAPYDAVVQIVEGEAEITIGGNAVHAREGDYGRDARKRPARASSCKAVQDAAHDDSCLADFGISHAGVKNDTRKRRR
jgi:hypothetical protein